MRWPRTPDYNAGRPGSRQPFNFLEIRIPINRLDLPAKQGLIRDFTRVMLEAEGSDNRTENARRVWVTIHEPRRRTGASAATLIGFATTPPPIQRSIE
jgi:hypothetical protein